MEVIRYTFSIILKIVFLLLFIASGTVKAENYTWIGGSGNWSDTLHWQSVSGGLPSQDDNVYFNAGSFTGPNQSIAINSEAFCRNLDFSGITQPVILLGGAKLNVFGSFVLSSLISNNYSGDIYFMATQPGNLIRLSGIELSSDLYFDGYGSWGIMDSLILNNNKMYLNMGAINTLGNFVRIGSFQSQSTGTKILKLGNSIFEITAHNGFWKVDENLVLIKDNSTLIFYHQNQNSTNVFDGGGLKDNNVVFKNDALIKSNNSFENLVFNAEHSYRLMSGSVQTLNGNLHARGCSGLIEIEASGSGQATIAKNNGNNDVAFVSLQSIKADFSPGFYFIANHSIDLGNNTNCIIYENSRNMYWVDGTGFWSDTLHWSSSPNNMDADCLPLPYDNVNFNDDSFYGPDTVFADFEETKVNHMTWNTVKKPVFKGAGLESLTIFGSLEWAPMMKNKFNGTTYFKDTLAGQTIKTSAVEFGGDVVFEGYSGGWTIQDSLLINGNVNFLAGSIDLTSDYATCFTFHSDSAFDRSMKMNDTYFEIQKTNPYPAWGIEVSNLDFDAGNSVIAFKSFNSAMNQFGEDTIQYNDVIFQAIYFTDRLITNNGAFGIFRRVIFGSNAQITGDNTYDTLSLTPGNFYEMKPGSKQTINYDIWPTGNCQGPVLLRSGVPGEIAYLSKDTDTLSVDYTAIYDIQAEGDAAFIANNSIDLGNNPGWDTIYTSAPGKLYWVDGTGDWEDPNHWSLSSGGPPGECIPTPYDTVIFDAFSFDSLNQKVTVNLNNAFVNDMYWTDAGFMPDFDGTVNSGFLRIFGSLYLNEEMTFSFPGNIYFESRDTAETIATRNVPFHNLNNNVFFYGPGGEWNLTEPLDVGINKANMNSIYLDYGNLITHNNDITCFNFYSTTSAQRLLDPDSSFIRVYNNWYVIGLHLNLAENNSMILIDSGFFKQRLGNYLPYNDLVMNAPANRQYVYCDRADSVMFRNVLFSNDGSMEGENGTVMARNVRFMKDGNINVEGGPELNVYSVDSLRFGGYGEVYGNDTAGWVRFDTAGIISGAGQYRDVKFNRRGNLYGNNVFDTLTFSPGYVYLLEGQAVQTVRQLFNIKGNNCEYINIYSTNNTKAIVKKDSGEVIGEHLRLKNINAIGDAGFNAGYFSENIDMSNDGWLFPELPYTYNLGKDISMLEGDTVTVCADYFNGNATTNYEWRNLETGEIVGTDSCLLVTQKGDYVLSVYYDEGGGCIKRDTIYIGCHLDLAVNKEDVSCYGFEDGQVETEMVIGVEPISYNWYSGGELFDTTSNLYDMPAMSLSYIIEDSLDCISKGEVNITQPDSLVLSYFKTDACFQMENGTITLVPAGGTTPYSFDWSNDSTVSNMVHLPPGEYNVSMSDANQCPAVDTLINIVELPAMSVVLSGYDLSCFQDSSGVISVDSITGGTGNYTEFLWTKDTLLFSNSTVPELKSLSAGTYTLYVKDDLGCAVTREIKIEQPEELNLLLESTGNQHELGSIDLTVTGGTQPYSYLWNTGFKTEDIDPLAGGNYTVEVFDDNGCYKTDSIFIDVHYRVYAPTGFTPNGDGLNDVFELKGLGTDLRNYKLWIFDRYGKQVFYTEKESEHWNGRLNNSGPELPSEVYLWQVELEFFGGQTAMDAGNITLLR